ncbi:hypothetical protein ACF1BQ_030525 [Bradyrhizobium sp. RDT10]
MASVALSDKPSHEAQTTIPPVPAPANFDSLPTVGGLVGVLGGSDGDVMFLSDTLSQPSYFFGLGFLKAVGRKFSNNLSFLIDEQKRPRARLLRGVPDENGKWDSNE